MVTPKASSKEEIVIAAPMKKTIVMQIIGTTPLIFHRLAAKAKRELILPAPKKNLAERASSLKHKPLEEFRDSAHMLPEGMPTALGLPTTAFKGAICTAGLDLPGTNKSQIGRLLWIPGEYVPIYGIPEVFTTMVRMSDKNRTPDMRTRMIVREWACELAATFIAPMLNAQSVANLVATGGMTVGVGDFRQQKGAGNYGSFEVVADDEQEARYTIITSAARAAQLRAIEEAAAYDSETSELLRWYDTEVVRRGMKAA
jgi:hypothetical protein